MHTSQGIIPLVTFPVWSVTELQRVFAITVHRIHARPSDGDVGHAGQVQRGNQEDAKV